jgi:hypothetical protein
VLLARLGINGGDGNSKRGGGGVGLLAAAGCGLQGKGDGEWLGLRFAGKEAAAFIGMGPEAPLARTPRRGGGGAVYWPQPLAMRPAGWASAESVAGLERVGSGP